MLSALDSLNRYAGSFVSQHHYLFACAAGLNTPLPQHPLVYQVR